MSSDNVADNNTAVDVKVAMRWRENWYARHHRKQRPHKDSQAKPLSRADKKSKRKQQRLSRRKNRK